MGSKESLSYNIFIFVDVSVCMKGTNEKCTSYDILMEDLC
jgi:hypothetical protein